jgi:hypothetical protein
MPRCSDFPLRELDLPLGTLAALEIERLTVEDEEEEPAEGSAPAAEGAGEEEAAAGGEEPGGGEADVGEPADLTSEADPEKLPGSE